MENLDPLPQNQSAFFPSRGFILDFLGWWWWGVCWGLLFRFILSKIGVLEFLSFSWVNKFCHPFIKRHFVLASSAAPKKPSLYNKLTLNNSYIG